MIGISQVGLAATHVAQTCRWASRLNCVACLGAIATIAAASAYADQGRPSGGTEIVIADEVRTAFYEHARSSLAAAMSKAVGLWCSTEDRHRVAESGKSNAETVEWLCGRHQLRYFRNVYVTGARGPHGLVCEDVGTSSLKYFGVDLTKDSIEFGSCVPAEWDGTAYQLHFENVNTSSDA
jgi:hypothetical protein